MGATALVAASAFCAAPGNRVFYGFTLGSAEFATESRPYDYGFVKYPFNPSDEDAEILGDLLDSYYDTPFVGVYAGTGVDGLIYACEYEFYSSTSAPTATNLVVYNTFNGLKEAVGPWNPDQTDFKPQDMAWSKKDGKMYAIGFESSRSGLYEVDINSGKFTKLCNITNGGGTLAVHPDGTFYSISSSGSLFTIDPATGVATFVMDTQLGNMLSNQSMEFDEASGLLYWVSNTTGHPQGYENSWLQEIDVEKKTIREIGSVGIGSRFVALSIPSASNLLAPGAPVVSAVAGADGSLSATLTFNVPETTLSGSTDLGTIYGYVIKRNGEQVYASAAGLTLTPGESLTWTDTTVPTNGNYRYDVYFYNGKGDGADGTAFQYVGEDAPGRVSAITGEVSDDMRSLTLKWDAPTVGLHLGAFNPESVTYTVVRNDNRKIAEGIKECMVTDNNFARLMKYSYTIIASNTEGESEAYSSDYILGPAYDLPYEQTFEEPAQIMNRWNVIDGNNDGFTWLFNTTLGQTAFGDFESAAEYIVSPGLGNSNQGTANDWLISPPMNLEADTEYEVTISSRSYTDDQIEVYMGVNNQLASQTEKIGNIDLHSDPTNPEIDPALGTQKFVRNSVAVPVMTEDAIRCFGIRLVTKHLDHNFIQINGIFFGKKGEFSGINEVAAAENVSIAVNGKQVTVFGAFRQADVYEVSGKKVASTSSALIDLSNLATGVYIISVDGRSFKVAL
ncbi:MAG: choice-of-anchor J domain-containing protein [Muribaculaceae bacterium]|nr:choice-of-anchor J domain-containing protein [Muribaculaceae bacterium]